MKTRKQLENIKTGILVIACALFMTVAITPSQVMRSYVFAQFEDEEGGGGCKKKGTASWPGGVLDCDCNGTGTTCTCTLPAEACPPSGS